IGDHAFYSCGSLETITLPDTDIKIGNFVFNGCDKLVSVSLPDSITALPTGMFGNCHNLESVVIPDTVTEIGEVCFNNCHKLKEIVIQDSVKTIGSAAFENCADLTSITIENPECTIYDSETTIFNTAEIRGYANSTAQAYAEKYSRKFVALEEKSAAEIVASGECGAEGYELTWSLDSKGTLTISGTGEMDSWALNSPWSEHSDKITKVIIENGVTTIGEQAFSGCEKIAEITIPDSVTNIKTGAFFDCTGLTSIKIPESVTEMGHSAFYGCVNLKEVTLPSGVGTINIGVFRDCQSLETITFSKNVKKVDFTALCGCSNLKSVIFEHPGCRIADAEHTICNSHDFDTEENVFNGTIYGYENSTAQAYAEKYNRKFVALEGKPAIEVIDSGECGGMEEDGVSWMFDSEGTLTISGAWGGMYFHDNNIPWRNYQKDIVKVVVEKGVTGIEVAAFSYCTNLKSVTISDDIMYIGPYAFCGCTSLESIVIPDGVTDIEYSTFRDCINLTSVTLPESIIEIGHSAFEGCEKLASITLKNPECVIDDVENTIPDTTVIYGCENSEVQAYAEKYNIKFVALEDNPAAVVLGDVNEDGKVDSSDASLVLEEYAVIQTGGAGAFTENQKKAADVNNDSKTDSSDASKILEYYAMISTGKEPSWD
ncbi:MAG: leucine-rich repeat protein, partial [Ruminococcus sp.]|nr:leucine-rich repeat protein [Ruminococcus sp.]